MYKHILVAFDKSETAHKALQQAIEIARLDPEVKLEILYVTSLPDTEIAKSYTSGVIGAGEPMMIDVQDVIRRRNLALDQERSEILDDIESMYSDISDRVELNLETGLAPVDTIIDFCNEHKCDLIVMGCRGLGALRGMLGSVSYGVLRQSEAPVLIIK